MALDTSGRISFTVASLDAIKHPCQQPALAARPQSECSPSRHSLQDHELCSAKSKTARVRAPLGRLSSSRIVKWFVLTTGISWPGRCDWAR
jgi:hypothetical protein